MTRQFLPFVAITNYPTLLRWTGHFGPECEFQSSHVVFLDAQIDGDGRWIIPLGTLCAFVKTAQMANGPQLLAEPYAGVAHTSVQSAKATEFWVFCGVAIALARMRNHVAMLVQRGEAVVDPGMRDEAEPCGFCERSSGAWTESILRGEISSTCPCVVTLKPAVAMRKQENMPRECPIPGCSVTRGF